MLFSKCLVALLVVGADGLRRKRSRSSSQPGHVDALFSYAAPSSASPPLQNPHGKCFPGIRSWTMEEGWATGTKYYDVITMLAGIGGFAHPYIKGLELDLTNQKITETPCEDAPHQPLGAPGMTIHRIPFYNNVSVLHSDLLKNISLVGIASCETLDRETAAEEVARYGWNLIGSAVDEGGIIYVGKQVSHLIQEPSTKACILTFQGTKSVQDVIADVNIVHGHFCGFVKEHERCAPDAQSCIVEEDGETFVHSGFRDCLRAMVKNEDWQREVRGQLHKCSKVYVAGHSLGAAQAELFTACAHKNLQPGDYGYEDFQYIGWTV